MQLVNGEPIALGIVLSLDTLGISSRDDTRTALAMVRDWLNDGDGCIAVNATGFHSWDEEHRGFGKIRQSDIALGRLGCLPLLQDLAQRMAVWRHQGMETGYVGYTWTGVRRALQELDRDPRLRKAIIVFGKGADWDHFSLPQSLKSLAAGRMTPIFSLYFPPEDLSDPKVRAKVAEITGNQSVLPLTPILKGKLTVGLKALDKLTQASGGGLYQVSEESILPVAKGLIASLRQQCQLTYEPPADGAPGFRKIEVTISTPGWKVRHRPGYYPDQLAAPAKP
ncbi:MAG: hypothetical protein IPP47_00325 [Bryobacterales bacterium]|nr:hypothetical protein [Bryobacterales bacterium]